MRADGPRDPTQRSQEGIGLAIDRMHKRAFLGDLGGSVRMIALDHPVKESVVFSGHEPLTGIAYVGG